MHARMSLFQYFANMVEERRKKPTDDITSLLAHATVDGGSMPVFELLSYYFLLVVAGNETTRNATSGGLLALIEHPEQWRKLKADPSLVESAVEEIVRWTTPVIQFCRTPVRDTEVRGQKIRAGENLCLFYPSANRDEEVFDEPFRFRIDRDPNRHVGFGHGEHFCLGAHLARRSQRALFGELTRRLEHVERTAEPQWISSSFVVGFKHLPIRYRIARGA